jgi:vacuolar protein sorting-associated protein 13A/C
MLTIQQLKAHVNGFQLVLIGDLQEIPFVHLSTDEFQIAVNDWSGDVSLPRMPGLPVFLH